MVAAEAESDSVPVTTNPCSGGFGNPLWAAGLWVLMLLRDDLWIAGSRIPDSAGWWHLCLTSAPLPGAPGYGLAVSSLK
ncbi:hypothetical protein LEMLEM_LOCUS3629 [Lemmus lemmus]